MTTPSMQPAKVRADIKRNRLYITLPAHVTPKELERVYSDIRFNVADLKPGFDVITDLSNCNIGHLSAIAPLRKIMAYLVAQKVGRVVRIVGDMHVILRQLIGWASRYHSYKPVYVLTLEEAEEELKYPIKPDGIRFQLNGRKVEYTVGQRARTGSVIDISTSGCALSGETTGLVSGMEVLLAISLRNQEGVSTPCSFKAEVDLPIGAAYQFRYLLDDDRWENDWNADTYCYSEFGNCENSVVEV